MKQAKLIALPFINISPYKRWNPIFKGWIAGRTLIFKHTLEKLQTRLKTTKAILDSNEKTWGTYCMVWLQKTTIYRLEPCFQLRNLDGVGICHWLNCNTIPLVGLKLPLAVQ